MGKNKLYGPFNREEMSYRIPQDQLYRFFEEAKEPLDRSMQELGNELLMQDNGAEGLLNRILHGGLIGQIAPRREDYGDYAGTYIPSSKIRDPWQSRTDTIEIASDYFRPLYSQKLYENATDSEKETMLLNKKRLGGELGLLEYIFHEGIHSNPWEEPEDPFWSSDGGTVKDAITHPSHIPPAMLFDLNKNYGVEKPFDWSQENYREVIDKNLMKKVGGSYQLSTELQNPNLKGLIGEIIQGYHGSIEKERSDIQFGKFEDKPRRTKNIWKDD